MTFRYLVVRFRGEIAYVRLRVIEERLDAMQALEQIGLQMISSAKATTSIGRANGI
jgi:hypothetical protein